MKTKPALFALAVFTALPLAVRAQSTEIIPTIGAGKPTGDDSDDFDAGGAIGISIGRRVHPSWSLHGQAEVALLEPKAPDPDGIDGSGAMALISFAPLYHPTLGGDMDLFLGPTVGVFAATLDFEEGSDEERYTLRGYTFGLAAGLLFKVSDAVRLGPYLRYARTTATKVCASWNGDEECDSDPPSEDAGFLSLSVAAYFP